MDFVSDSLSTGMCIKCLTMADDLSHECMSISSQYVTRLLDQAAVFRGYRMAVRASTAKEINRACKPEPPRCEWRGGRGRSVSWKKKILRIFQTVSMDERSPVT